MDRAAMSAPDWREVFAGVLQYAANEARRYTWQDDVDDEMARAAADAILAAIAERGYRLHRDHDWVPNPDPILTALDYPAMPRKCVRQGCGVLSGGLRDHASCEGEPR
jgi:hypothetical protein